MTRRTLSSGSVIAASPGKPATSSWTRLTDRAQTSVVAFRHLASGRRYRVIQDIEWDSDGKVASSIQQLCRA
jgi:hypothetical protein